MEKISKGLVKLSSKLFESEDESKAFVNSIVEPAVQDVSLIWLSTTPSQFSFLEKHPWEPSFVTRVELKEKPGAHSLHEAGAYYCLDTSSVFSASVLTAVQNKPETIVDLCASPGGKSAFAWKLLSPKMVVCNEVIGKRIPALISNLKRCHIAPSMVTNLDTRIWGQRYPSSADLVIVDAPCSGQSLLVKGKKSDGCFHPATINMNSNRQKRIISNASQIVKSGGYLAYVTCTFSPEENEKVVEWFLKRFKMFAAVYVEKLSAFQSHLTDTPCYRLWPHKIKGAGAFCCLFQNTSENEIDTDLNELKPVWRGSR